MVFLAITTSVVINELISGLVIDGWLAPKTRHYCWAKTLLATRDLTPRNLRSDHSVMARGFIYKLYLFDFWCFGSREIDEIKEEKHRADQRRNECRLLRKIRENMVYTKCMVCDGKGRDTNNRAPIACD